VLALYPCRSSRRAQLPRCPRPAGELRPSGAGHRRRGREARDRPAGGPRRPDAAGGARERGRRRARRALPRGGGRGGPAPAAVRRGGAEGGVLPHRVRHREAVVGAALLPEALPRGPPRVQPHGRGPRHAVGGLPRAEPRDRVLAARALSPRLPQPQPHAARRAPLLDRLPGRAHGAGDLRPRLAPARRLRGRARGPAGGAQGALPAEGDSRRAARGLQAALRPHVRPAEPEGPRHVRVHGDRAPESGLPALHPAQPRARAAQPLALPELEKLWRTLLRHVPELG